MLVGVFNRESATKGGVVWSCVSGVFDALPNQYTSRICEGHEDLPSYKAVLEAIKLKRSLPVLKWTSESEYLSFKFFLQTLYIYQNKYWRVGGLHGNQGY